MSIAAIYESPKVLLYLQEHQLMRQYKKAKTLLLSGFPQKLYFKVRQPKHEEVYQFRINRKYRAFGYFQKDEFFVFNISDHQD